MFAKKKASALQKNARQKNVKQKKRYA